MIIEVDAVVDKGGITVELIAIAIGIMKIEQDQ